MKYVKRASFPSVEILTRAIETVEKKLVTYADTAKADTAREYISQLKKATKESERRILQIAKNFFRIELPKAFEEGQDLSDEKTEEKKSTKKHAEEVLKKQGFKYGYKGIGYSSYLEVHSACIGAGEEFVKRMNAIAKDLEKKGTLTIITMREEMAKDLRKNGTFHVTYSNGAKVNIASYAAMAARSARIETQNIGGIGRALEHGTDLVKMLGNYPTCPECAKYIGKVFSISGKSEHYPPLFGENAPLSKGYALVHPNDRCEFVPWFESMETKETIERVRSISNTEQEQTQTAAYLYKKWQEQHRKGWQHDEERE